MMTFCEDQEWRRIVDTSLMIMHVCRVYCVCLTISLFTVVCASCVGTQVLRNYIHEIGIFEKQSAGWFQAITAKTHLQGNIIFNIPRAGLFACTATTRCGCWLLVFNVQSIWLQLGFSNRRVEIDRARQTEHWTKFFYGCHIACFFPWLGINLNDAFGGGHELHDNLIFNAVRESWDVCT